MLKELKKKAEKFDSDRVKEAGAFAGRYTGVCVGAGLKGLLAFGKGVYEGARSGSVAAAAAIEAGKSELALPGKSCLPNHPEGDEEV